MIILASQSPRRREILEKLVPEFIVCPSDSDEDIESCPPCEYVVRLAERKARSVAEKYPLDTVVAADTIVCLEGVIMGKPYDEEDAKKSLKALSGRMHTVFTGVAVIHGGRLYKFCEGTNVFFRSLTESLISEYISSGEPMDKAGGYGIQGIGGRFVESIEGDFFNVMGLPLCTLSKLFEELGIVSGGSAK
ncbi:MAG: nucleoside triphosphate pyrophosphatase [Clostridiaceae bacterium]|nr:nucleoside triphosphate pyrophosphatase [Clostridiaceae bacterium]